MRVEIVCNGHTCFLEVAPSELLISVVRERLMLTGTKLGCGTGDCGACTVLVDGDPVNACLVYACECDGKSVVTVEGVAQSAAGELLVAEFSDGGAVQCGFCTPGIIVTAAATLARGPVHDDRAAIEEALAGNLCRCTGYFPILAAVQAASARLYGREPVDPDGVTQRPGGR